MLINFWALLALTSLVLVYHIFIACIVLNIVHIFSYYHEIAIVINFNINLKNQPIFHVTFDKICCAPRSFIFSILLGNKDFKNKHLHMNHQNLQDCNFWIRFQFIRWIYKDKLKHRFVVDLYNKVLTNVRLVSGCLYHGKEMFCYFKGNTNFFFCSRMFWHRQKRQVSKM